MLAVRAKEAGWGREARGRANLVALGSLPPTIRLILHAPYCCLFHHEILFEQRVTKKFETQFLCHLSFRGEDHNIYPNLHNPV